MCLFRRRDRRTKVRNPKIAVSTSLCEGAGFRDLFSVIFNDTYRMSGLIVSFGAVKVGEKCKHSVATVRALLVLIYK
jgi:hypothetical protein